MWSVGWAVTRHDWFPYKKRRLGHRLAEGDHVRPQWADSVYMPGSEETTLADPSIPYLLPWPGDSVARGVRSRPLATALDN